MPGMKCWAGDFANKAGRETILREIEKAQRKYDEAKAIFDELDVENQRQLAAER